MVGMCDTTKSSNTTAGQLRQGCPFRIPLVPCHEHTKWYVGIQECLRTIGVPPNASYLVPMSTEAYAWNLDAGGADAATSIRRLRRAFAKLGWLASVIRAITEHTSKRSVGRVVQRYYGALSRPCPDEDSAFLHHRETGPHKPARAYNPDDLVAPVGMIAPILEDWLSAHVQFEEQPPVRLPPSSGASCRRTPSVRDREEPRIAIFWLCTQVLPPVQDSGQAWLPSGRRHLPAHLQLSGCSQGHHGKYCRGVPRVLPRDVRWV